MEKTKAYPDLEYQFPAGYCELRLEQNGELLFCHKLKKSKLENKGGNFNLLTLINLMTYFEGQEVNSVHTAIWDSKVQAVTVINGWNNSTSCRYIYQAYHGSTSLVPTQKSLYFIIHKMSTITVFKKFG